jgi:YtkA-like
MRALLVTAIVALAAAGTAAAGGFATVGLDSQPPDGGGPGSTWDVTLNVLQHGVTPLDGVSPTIVIRNLDNGETQTFAATPTGEPGKYAAKVVFPSAGRWEYVVNDDFSQTHTFKPITISGDAAAAGTSDGDGGGYSVPWTIVGSTAIVLAFVAMFLIARRPARAAASH